MLSTAEVEQLAEMLGWQRYDFATDSPSVYYTKDDDVEAAEYKELRGGWAWHLTKAGAWDVLVGLKWTIENYAGSGRWCVAGYERCFHKDPLTALTLALKEYLNG